MELENQMTLLQRLLGLWWGGCLFFVSLRQGSKSKLGPRLGVFRVFSWRNIFPDFPGGTDEVNRSLGREPLLMVPFSPTTFDSVFFVFQLPGDYRSRRHLHVQVSNLVVQHPVWTVWLYPTPLSWSALKVIMLPNVGALLSLLFICLGFNASL